MIWRRTSIKVQGMGVKKNHPFQLSLKCMKGRNPNLIVLRDKVVFLELHQSIDTKPETLFTVLLEASFVLFVCCDFINKRFFSLSRCCFCIFRRFLKPTCFALLCLPGTFLRLICLSDLCSLETLNGK